MGCVGHSGVTDVIMEHTGHDGVTDVRDDVMPVPRLTPVQAIQARPPGHWFSVVSCGLVSYSRKKKKNCNIVTFPGVGHSSGHGWHPHKQLTTAPEIHRIWAFQLLLPYDWALHIQVRMFG